MAKILPAKENIRGWEEIAHEKRARHTGIQEKKTREKDLMNDEKATR